MANFRTIVFRSFLLENTGQAVQVEDQRVEGEFSISVRLTRVIEAIHPPPSGFVEMAPEHQVLAFVENIAVRPDATATDVIQHRRSLLWGGRRVADRPNVLPALFRRHDAHFRPLLNW